MGYTTKFRGSFEISPSLSEELFDYLILFSSTRRMKREPLRLPPVEEFYTPTGTWGMEGEFFVYGEGFHDDSVISHKAPPSFQPGLWCQWVPTSSSLLEWNGAEKFYYYVEWLRYLITMIFEPLGYKLNGSVRWRGEEFDDIGTITICDNVVS